MLNVCSSRSMQLMSVMSAETACISVCAGIPGNIASHPGCSELPDCLHNGACSPFFLFLLLKGKEGSRPRLTLGCGKIFLHGRQLKIFWGDVVAMLARKIYVDPWSLCIGLGQKYLLHTYSTYNAYHTYRIGLTSAHTDEKGSKIGGEKFLMRLVLK